MEQKPDNKQKTESTENREQENEKPEPGTSHPPTTKKANPGVDQQVLMKQLLQEKIKMDQMKKPHELDEADMKDLNSSDSPQSRFAMSDMKMGGSMEATNYNNTSESTSSPNKMTNGTADETVKPNHKFLFNNPNWVPFGSSEFPSEIDLSILSASPERIRSKETSIENMGTKMSPTTLENLIKVLDQAEDESQKEQDREKRAQNKDPNQVHEIPTIPTTGSSEYMKRESEFVIPGGNPIRISHEELFKTLKGFDNMYLVHEISLNPEFRVERYVPPPESIENRIQVQLKRAYWDLFNEDLRMDPPDYRRAIQVFREVKENILGLLLPHNTKTREIINRELDVDLISQRIEHDAFTYDDFKTYSSFIIQALAQLCSPSRDGDIEILKTLDDPAQIFQGILDLADKMKLDIANFFIQQFRPNIIRQCASYERIKFADFLCMTLRLGVDGLQKTRNWLTRHSANRTDISTILANGFLEMMTSGYIETPETVELDLRRFHQLGPRIVRLAVIGAISVTGSGHLHAIIGDTPQELRDLLAKEIKPIITEGVEELIFDEYDMMSRIEVAAERTLAITNDFVKQRLGRDLNATEAGSLRQCINEIWMDDNKVRALIYQRILDYAEQMFIAEPNQLPPVPSGLYSIQNDVVSLVRPLAQVVALNRQVYGKLYAAILGNEIGPFTVFGENAVDPEFEKVMQILRDDGLQVLKPPVTVETKESETETSTSS